MENEGKRMKARCMVQPGSLGVEENSTGERKEPVRAKTVVSNRPGPPIAVVCSNGKKWWREIKGSANPTAQKN